MYVGASEPRRTPNAGSTANTPLSQVATVPPSAASQPAPLPQSGHASSSSDGDFARPAATYTLPSCGAGRQHRWQPAYSARLLQHFICSACQLYIHEVKRDGQWITVSHRNQTAHGEDSGDNDVVDDSMSVHSQSSDSAYFSADEDDDEFADAISILHEDPSPKQEESVDDSTTVNDGQRSTPSSLSGFTYLAALPTASGSRAKVEPTDNGKLSPSHSASSWTLVDHAETSTATSSAATLVDPMSRVLVSANPKPLGPVATKVRKCTTGRGQHVWTIVSANACQRHYRCACGVSAKEKKEGDPEIWRPL